ncbi:MAG TPA: COR domain-containing protein [Thermoanaerobaculia bacterium]|nr:COR domain-containing protein [Thermoanaerobaculia bacterium]
MKFKSLDSDLGALGLARRLAQDAAEGPAIRQNLSYSYDSSDPSSLRADPNVEILDLRGNHLRVVPWEVRQFENLRILDLRGNPLHTLIDRPGLIVDWDVFSRLEHQITPGHVLGISFDDTPLKLPPQLFELPNLRQLEFQSPDQSELPTGIGELQALETLTVQAPLRTFPTEVLPLQNLKVLRLTGRMKIIPDELAQLTHLRALTITGNSLREFPSAVRHLRELRHLNLSNNDLPTLPDWIGEMKSLRVLWFVQNQMRAIPPTIGGLHRLTAFVAPRNQLEVLPPSFAELDHLRALALGNNPFQEVPEPLFSLLDLEALDLSAYAIRGALKVIPEKLLALPRLKVLELDGQPIETPPPEVVAQGLDAMRAYYRQLDDGKDYLCEAKLLIVGEPGAGKTSLTKKIENPDYQLREDEQSTEGIGIIHTTFPTRLRVEGSADTLARDFHVSIWDFGGQEIYHATHQFFLTRRSLYVLVADSRKEDTDFHYWMNIVELLSDGSPLLVIKNEKQDRRRDINESRLRGRFANLRAVYATNLATNRGLNDAVRAIREELERLPHIGSPLPKTWRRVREAVEQDGRDYINLTEFLEICRLHGFTREEDMLQLSGYLHDLGVCLHFQDDPLLRKVVMLRPRWATDAVYRVLDHKDVMDRHGRFTRGDLAAIWSEARYAEMRDELVQLMMKFQLCYPLSNDSFLAPQLLGSNPASYPWDAEGNLVVRYDYEFMPKGILTRFIVAAHALIERQEWLWRDGVVLKRHATRAEVTEDYSERRITVRLAGPEKQEMLAIIDYELERIHGEYPRLKMNQFIPCRCPLCAERQEPHFFPYDVLRRFARDGKSIQCQESYEMVDARELIAAVFPSDGFQSLYSYFRDADGLTTPAPPERRREVFVSYAWGGESERIVDRLEQAFRAQGIAVVRDKNEMRYKDSIQEFMRRIGRGTCIVVVISRDYLQSKSCMFELTQIAERGDIRDRVFPIVLQDADLSDAVKRVAYVKWWEEKIRELNAALKGVDQQDLEGIREELDLYAQIRRTISRWMTIIGDMNTLTPESHLDSRFETLMSAIHAQLQS